MTDCRKECCFHSWQQHQMPSISPGKVYSSSALAMTIVQYEYYRARKIQQKQKRSNSNSSQLGEMLAMISCFKEGRISVPQFAPFNIKIINYRRQHKGKFIRLLLYSIVSRQGHRIVEMEQIQELINNGRELTIQQYHQVRSLWANTPSVLKMQMASNTLNNLSKKLVTQNGLEQNGMALSKLLSLQFTLQQAICLQMTNHLAYISHLTKINKIECESLLKEINMFMERVQHQLLKSMHAQSEYYQQLQKEQLYDSND